MSKHIFFALSGRWSFFRKLPNRAHANGCATFTLNPLHELYYREDGKLYLSSGSVTKIWREYIYRYSCKDDLLSCYFYDDQRLFHRLKFNEKKINNELMATGTHLCREDLYSVSYDFTNLNNHHQFIIQYQITGPEKKYMIHTTFRRCDA